jgi:hypothetical protein
VCDATVLPHWVHLFNCGGCQRCDALRVRRRIFDVLRLGTPIRRGVGKQAFAKRQPRLPPIMLMLLIMILIFWKDQEQDQDQEQEFLD